MAPSQYSILDERGDNYAGKTTKEAKRSSLPLLPILLSSLKTN
jgi:hypothetical protein